jgi:hypothetical protein
MTQYLSANAIPDTGHDGLPGGKPAELRRLLGEAQHADARQKWLGAQNLLRMSQFPSTLARMIEGSAAEARWKSLRPHRQRASGHD